ncbi:hypothetical protein EJ02DRAFT_502973 [Clathrospora elynae]|uniref:Uncharacterized protein n=1 Tax=Clathrospora elynae TaxID=706981 RepID=A0A6A5SRH1_9PLEO|nr:hypothetical protein EJ02DRAFT_502973 [Clathrospora elynae]
MGQARGTSPRRSEHGSTLGSTARSKQSERSQQSAMAVQAQLETLDELSVRGKIESRSERNLFKRTGQIPPTPITGAYSEDDVYIRTEDLRAQCRAASGLGEKNLEDAVKSPKKKLFAGMRNPFSKTPHVPTPSMPLKAAQVLGTAARQPHVIAVRPIKPARPYYTPTKVSRSETAKSLPAKVVSPDTYSRRRRSGSMRRNRPAGRRSSGRGSNKSSDAENSPPVPQNNASFESAPTPPAKDTPPPDQRAESPLRRAFPAQDLRGNYEADVGKSTQLRFPDFALSPSPSTSILPGNGGASPTKFRPYTAKDYTKLVEDNNRSSHHLSPLHPRFYSPSNRSFHAFADGETPSKNSDTSRLLFSVPSKGNLLHVREDSNNGSIDMIFQGDVREIDPNSPTARQLSSKTDPNMKSTKTRADVGLTTRVMEELRIGDKYGSIPSGQKHGTAGHLPLDQSSSRLTDMLNTVSPGRSVSHGDFQPNCPSAVPSPLHKASGSLTPGQTVVPPHGSFSPWPQPSPKCIDDHFFMTNEHLDVVGKTTWDLLDMFHNQQTDTSKAKHEQLVGLVEKHVEEIKGQITTVNEKADRTADIAANQHKMCASLDSLKDFVKENVIKSLSEQNKKTSGIEVQMQELKQMVHTMQKLLEQKLPESKIVQQHVPTAGMSTPNTAHSPLPPPNHRPQPPLAGYYGTSTEVGRDGPPPMPHLHDNRSMSSPQDGPVDSRGGYNTPYGQQWAARPGYPGRDNKEDRTPLPATANPYHFANSGQYGNGYAGGYSSFNFTPSPPGLHYGFNPGQAK